MQVENILEKVIPVFARQRLSLTDQTGIAIRFSSMKPGMDRAEAIR